MMNTQTTTWRPNIWHGLVALMTFGGCIWFGVSPAQAETPGKTAAGLSVEGELAPFLGEPKMEMQQVFKGDRFPNVVVATDGTVLAFWNGVKVRRSEDAGKTWGDEILVGKGFMGGGVTVDENSGDILAFVETKHQLGASLTVYRSNDHGKTWRAQETVIHPNKDGNIPTMHMNEHGITLRHGKHKGRLLRPSRWYAGSNGPTFYPQHYTDAIYSDDGGKTWHTSDPFPAMGTGEATVAELSDGRIYYNSRRHWAPKGVNARRRWTAWGDDGGQTWKDISICEILPDGDQCRDYGLMGGLVRLPVQGRDVLIFSNIESPTGRNHGTVWASFDGGKTWPIKRLVFEGPFAYSSLDAGRPGTPSKGWIYLQFEKGEAGATVARFNLAWLLKGEKTGDGEVPKWLSNSPASAASSAHPILSVPLLLWSLGAYGAANDVEALKADMKFFADASCSQLKASVRIKDLADFKSELLKTVAAGMLDGQYDKTYRAASYEAYPSPRELGRTLKLGDGFSRYENITGICLEPGENVVFVGNSQGKELSLLLPDWMRKPAAGIRPEKDPNGWGLHKQEAGLKEGVNVIHVKKGGNAYVSYFDDHAEQAPKVTVHFPMGKVNGFFDASKHTDADWNRLLDHAVSPVMDARGKHIQVAYPVEWFNVYTRGKGVELINNYDAMLNHHYTLMGLVKYKKVPKNRILARVNFNFYMFRDGDGVAYLGNKGTMGMVADPKVVIVGDPCWGFCHEVGHALQMRQMTWGGMTEVSNNIFSLYTGGKMGNESRLKAQKNYASARKNIVEAQPKKSFLHVADVFDRLVPFWQLHLYFSRSGRPDFYADVMEEMRCRPDAGSGDDSIRNQFEFVKICCDVAKLDLTDFFDKWGFFWVGDITVNDYRKYHYTITQQMVDDAKSHIAKRQYKKPVVDITLIEE